VVAVAACGQWFTYVPEVDFGNITVIVRKWTLSLG
jgi:hypothetical protein